MKLGRVVPIVLITASCSLMAQTFDTSGNGMLNGTYYFRQVAYYTDGQGYGDLQNGSALYGNIVFDGNGNYSLSNAIYYDISGQFGSYSHPGKYSISASGLGYISSPNPNSPGDLVYGLVSNGIFIASSTGNASGYNDLLIAAPAPSSNQAASALFTGTYSTAYMNFVSYGVNFGQTPTQVFDAAFQLNPNGTSLGAFSLTGYFLGTSGPTTQNFSMPSVKYSISGGAVVIAFPYSNTNPIAQTEYLYVSPDGNFVFGGSPQDIDMFVGVRAGSGAPNFSGMYYQAGLDEDESQLNNTGATLPDGYYGSLYAVSPTSTLNHQRLLSPVLNSTALDDTYSQSFQFNSDGSYDDQFGSHHLFAQGGTVSIGFGEGPIYGLNVTLKGPTRPGFTGSGVYLDPTLVQNAASSALFTTGVSPGEYLELTGSGLASGTLTSSAFPTILGNVQVLINFRPAPIYYVSPTTIIVLVPYATSGQVVQIQVINGNTRSNAVTVFSSLTAPGIFSADANGFGDARAQHSDYSLITSSKPAQPGESVVLYLTGLGLVSPLPAVDGTPAGSSPTSDTVQPLTAYIGGQQATIQFSGLTPSLVNVYQLNLQVPAGIAAGEAFVEIIGPGLGLLRGDDHSDRFWRNRRGNSSESVDPPRGQGCSSSN